MLYLKVNLAFLSRGMKEIGFFCVIISLTLLIGTEDRADISMSLFSLCKRCHFIPLNAWLQFKHSHFWGNIVFLICSAWWCGKMENAKKWKIFHLPIQVVCIINSVCSSWKVPCLFTQLHGLIGLAMFVISLTMSF